MNKRKKSDRSRLEELAGYQTPCRPLYIYIYYLYMLVWPVEYASTEEPRSLQVLLYLRVTSYIHTQDSALR